MKITNVMASSLDGHIAVSELEGDHERLQQGLTCDADRDFLLSEMAKADAIIVGASSIRANGCCLELPGPKQPIWLVLSRMEIPKKLNFWHQHGISRFIFAPTQLPMHSQQVQQVICSQDELVQQVCRFCHAYGLESALLFGGGIINKMFYAAGVVDELKISLAPLLIGRHGAPRVLAPGLPESVPLRLQSSHSRENFVFLEYKVRKSIEANF